MTRLTTHGLLGLALMLSLLTQVGRAQNTTVNPEADIDQLGALLAAQQQRIEVLRQRVAAAHSQDADTARVEEMRRQIREVLSETSFRESLMPSSLQAGYDKGFYIKSSDEKFLLKLNGAIQFRWTHYDVGKANHYLVPGFRRSDRTGSDVQRTRLILKGHAYSPDLTYLLQLRADASPGYPVRIRDAFINYRFHEGFQFRAGIFKVPATMARLTSGKHMQFVSRPMVEAVFGLNRGLGVQFWGKLFDKRVEYAFSVTNSFVNPNDRTITNDPAESDNNPTLAFRAVWHALGDKPGKDLKYEADLAYHESPALDFAFHYAFNDDHGDRRGIRIPFPAPGRFRTGGFGLTNTYGLQLNQFGLASAFKWRGFSARGEYILRIVDPRRAGRRPFASWWLLTGQGDTTVMHGAYVQVGYFLPIPGLENKIEAVARVGGISTCADEREGTWEYAGGLNYYINGNNTKIQADVTKVSEAPISSGPISLANVNDSPLVFRVQLQLAF